MKIIYIAANYNAFPHMQIIAALLRKAGHEVISRWIKGDHTGDNKEATWAVQDLVDLNAANTIIFFSEEFPNSRTRGGKHVEFGYALALSKRIILIGERKNVFHYLRQVEQFDTIEEFIETS